MRWKMKYYRNLKILNKLFLQTYILRAREEKIDVKSLNSKLTYWTILGKTHKKLYVFFSGQATKVYYRITSKSPRIYEMFKYQNVNFSGPCIRLHFV